jgi:hypothetical protein
MRPTLPALALLWAATGAAQSVISAKAALVHYAEGQVFVSHRPREQKFQMFPQMRERDLLGTESGRAEVLLNPNVFLRLDQASSLRVLSERITDPSVELLHGRFVLEVVEVHRGEPVTLTCGKATIAILKPGVYRIDALPAVVRVFGGKVLVEGEGRRMTVAKGEALPLDGSWRRSRFDRAQGDDFDLWSRQRSRLLLPSTAAQHPLEIGHHQLQ